MYHFSTIQKAREDDVDAIKALVNGIRKNFLKAFLAYVEKASSNETLKEILRLLEAGKQAEIPSFMDQFLKTFEGVVYDALIASGKFEVGLTGEQVMRFARQAFNGETPTVALSFNPGNPRAAAIAQTQAGRLIKEVSDSSRAVINQTLVDAQNGGFGTRKTAQEIKQNIGLTEKQLASVKRYENLLREGSSEALNRELRDKRFDRTVANANKKPLTEAQIQTMTDRYRAKMIAYRAETIARTESSESVNQGRAEAMRQNLEATGLTEDAVTKTWVATKDKRTRRSHKHGGLDGKTVLGLDTPFISPLTGARLKNPGDRSLGAPASELVQCRCTVTMRLKLPE